MPRKAVQPFGVVLGYYRRYLVRLLHVVGVQALRWIQTTKSPTKSVGRLYYCFAAASVRIMNGESRIINIIMRSPPRKV